MKTAKNKKGSVQIVLMALLLVVMIVANVALSVFAEAITTFLGGFGINFDNLDYAQGNQVCQDIAEEGIVLLKNENANGNPVLPLNVSADATEKYPVAVFGWGATDGGFITSGSGSGSSADRGAGNLVTFLEALEGKDAVMGKDDSGNDFMLMPEVWGRFEYYKPLIDMYKKYKSGRDNDNYWSAAYPFFNLIEPSATKVQPYLNGAIEFTDTALVVISRVGGESKDIPQTQRKVNPNNDNPNKNSTTEDKTRTYLQLSQEEEDLLDLVKDNFDKVIVIINACNTMELDFLEDEDIDAALSVSGTGQSGTVALANILAGNKKVVEYETDDDGKTVITDGQPVVKSEEIVAVSPSGKTVDTYAYDMTTAATYANAPNAMVANGSDGGERSYTNGGEYYIDYAEGIYVGYKWYETADAENFWESDYAKNKWGIENGYEDVVQYPFGFGLSYAKFEWVIEDVSPKAGAVIDEKTDITVKVRVSNISDVAGQDVVQIYYTPEYYAGGIEKASVNLVAFAKTEVLDPQGGEMDSQLLTITFSADDMKSFDYNDANKNGFSGYELEHGTYQISVRTDAHNVYEGDHTTFTYSVTDDIKMAKDTKTGVEVNNIFSVDTEDGDVAVDGTTTNANINYLKRSDMEGSFPTPQARRAKSSKMPANGWLNHANDVDASEMPITGDSSGGLYLTNDDGSLNEELIMELGSDYYDTKWDILLDQITVSELNGVVMGGGYRTKAIASIKKPENTDLDGPSGLNQENVTSGNVSSSWTSYPVETVMAQSWNAKMSYIYGLAIGNEAYNTKVSGWYAPGANIHRSPFDGRNFEYYSEDAYLSGIMAAETVRGATNTGLYCYVKHFAVNETEYNRSGLYTWLTEQSLREIYLKPFETCVKEGNANAIMSSFNRLGATWTGGNYKLLTTVLREEWGFKGSVVTDYADLGVGGYMNIDQGIRAGNDFWLDGTRTGMLNGYNDRTSATAVSCARQATKNILYTYCNTIYIQKQFSSGATADEDALKYATEVGSREASSAAATWIFWGWIPLDVIGFGGLGVWIFMFIRNAKKKKVAQ